MTDSLLLVEQYKTDALKGLDDMSLSGIVENDQHKLYKIISKIPSTMFENFIQMFLKLLTDNRVATYVHRWSSVI